jgi:O-antigen/teichoic acid export membrane protein
MNTQGTKKTYLNNGMIYLAASIITQAINLFLIPLYTKNLSVSEVGKYNIITSIQALLAIFVTLGIYSGVSRYFNETNDKRGLKNTALVFSVGWGIPVLIIGYIASSFLATIFLSGPQDAKYINYVIWSALLDCIIVTYTSYYSMEFRALFVSGVNIFNIVLKFILTWYFLIPMQEGIEGLLKAPIFSGIVIIVFLIFYDRKNLKIEMQMPELKRMIRYGTGLVPGQLSVWVLTLVDRYFIKEMINLSSVGIYSMAYKIGMLINPIFIFPFTKVFTPIKFSVYKEEDGAKKIRELFRFYNIIGWFFILGLSLFSNLAIHILATDEYVIGFKLVPLIAFSYFIWGLGEFYGLGLHIANKMGTNSLVVLFSAVVNVFLNILLIPLMGMYGSALATVASYAVANFLYYYLSKRYYDIGVSVWYPYRLGVIFCFVYILYLIVKPYLINIFFEISYNILLCIIYIFLCTKFKFLSVHELKKAIEMISSRFNNVIKKVKKRG